MLKKLGRMKESINTSNGNIKDINRNGLKKHKKYRKNTLIVVVLIL